MAKETKIFNIEEHGYFSANSKKELAEFFEIKESKISQIKDPIPETEKIISLHTLSQKRFQIKEAHHDIVFTNEPTRFFEIGEGVMIGNLKDFYVTEIYENGKFYVIENEQGDFRVIQWYRIFKIRTPEENNNIEIFSKEDTLNLTFMQQDVSSLLSKCHHFGVDMNPVYQRELVWTNQQKVELIDSIMNHIDIGKFVFIRNKFKVNEPNYQILDGKQRLNTILEFFEDRFSYKGKTYSELSWTDQRVFEGHSVSIAEVRDTDVDEKKIIEYFISLNVSGTPVEKEFLLNLKEKYLS